jgi:hypothetical protein
VLVFLRSLACLFTPIFSCFPPTLPVFLVPVAYFFMPVACLYLPLCPSFYTPFLPVYSHSHA